jgi:hypothetical protein
MNKHIKYATKRQPDGSYVVLMKDLNTNRVDIHSHHDTFDEANTELERLKSKPTQQETMKFFKELKNSINKQ